MNPHLFGTFEIAPDFRQAVDLWLDYYTSTESFDRAVCYARNERGIAIPITGDEIRACTRHARRVMERVTRRANELGISDESWRSAQKTALRLADRL